MTTPPRPPRLLLLSTVILAVAGVALLSVPHGQELSAPVPATPSAAHATTDPSAATAPPASQPTAPTTPGTAPNAPTLSSVLKSALPPHGEGVAGDRTIQQALQAAWPADLDARDERQLLADGRELLCADATGTGRTQWPAYFRDTDQAIAPAFSTARFRIQAAIARRDGSSARAVVHLVWAGTDRGGTYTDGRITDLHFTRTTSTKKGGGSAWTWHPRT